MCQVLARKGAFNRSLAWQQFRYGGVTPKGVAFWLAAAAGPAALRAWDWSAAFARRYLRRANVDVAARNGLQAYFRSLQVKSSNTKSSEKQEDNSGPQRAKASDFVHKP
jgi:hypothetical protein